MKRLKEFKTERIILIEKVKSLEDELNESKSHLKKKKKKKKFSNNKLVQMLSDQKCCFDKSGLGFNKFTTSSSHIASTSRTMFVKPRTSDNKTHMDYVDKEKKCQFA
jgi:hypothetical protein